MRFVFRWRGPGMKTKTNARRNWTLVALAGAFGLAGILPTVGGESQIADLGQLIDSVGGDIVVVNLENPPRKVDRKPASDVGRQMVDLLERDGAAR